MALMPTIVIVYLEYQSCKSAGCTSVPGQSRAERRNEFGLDTLNLPSVQHSASSVHSTALCNKQKKTSKTYRMMTTQN